MNPLISILRLSFVLMLYFASIIRPCSAQKSSLNFEHLTTADGLSSDNITCMLQDSRGFIWIGTWSAGLNRYDGREVKFFRHHPADSLSLSHAGVRRLWEDAEGYIWVFTNGSFINRFDPKREVFERFDKTAPAVEHIDVVRRRKDLEAVVDFDGIIWQLETQDGRKPIINYSNHSFLERWNKTVWIADPDGIRIYDPQKNEIRDFVPVNKNFHPDDFKRTAILFEDPYRKIWLNTPAGILRVDPERNEITTITEDNFYVAYFSLMYRDRTVADDQGRIWISVSGLKIYDPFQEELDHYLPNPFKYNSISSQSTSCLMKDKDGRIWIGTEGNGVNIWDPYVLNVTHYRHNPYDPESLFGSMVTSCLEDTDKGLWVATRDGSDGGTISYFDYETEAFIPCEVENYKSGWFGSFFEDHSKNVLVEQFRPFDVLIFDDFLQKFKPYEPKGLPVTLPDFTRPFPFTDSKGNRYYYSFPGGMRPADSLKVGLYFFEAESGEVTHYTSSPDDPDSLSANFIYQIIEYSKDHSIWIATHGGGLNRFDPESGRFIQYRHDTADPSTISSNLPTKIFEDRKGNLWVGHAYGKGADMIPAKAIQTDSIYFVRYNKFNSNLPSNSINNFAEDGKGYLWMHTLRGPVRFDYEKKQFQSFQISQKAISTGHWSFSKGKSGRFYVGTADGLFSYHPDSIRQNERPPEVYITDFKIDNQSVPVRDTPGDTMKGGSPLPSAILFAKEIDLNYSQNDFSFEFAALNYTHPEQNRFQFRLEPYDKNWQEPNTEIPFVNYTNIPPGTYTFQVIAENNDGVLNEEGAVLKITIAPPWYRTWWAYSLYVIALIGLMVMIRRYELNRYRAKTEARRLKELDEVKNRLYTNITHEFRTPLTIMLGMSKKMEEDPKTWFREGIDMIKRNGNQLLQLVNQILDLRKLESGKLNLHPVQADIIAYLKYLLHSFHTHAGARNIKLHFLSGEKELWMDFDPDKIRHVITNLVSNAIKYNEEEGDVYLKVSRKEAFLQLEVQDNGIGIPEDQLPFIFDRFYQVDSDRHRQAGRAGEGTGIGLALTRELIKLMKGDITVKSTPGEGTLFRIRLPIHQNERVQSLEDLKMDAAILPSAQPSASGATAQPGRSSLPLLLIVEDNPDVIRYLKACLEKDYELEIATDGEEGIEKALEIVPDLIVSDVMMPKKDGYELCATLKEDQRSSHIPIVLLTAKGDLDSKVAGLGKGADAYLTKPFEEKELLVRLQQLIELRRKLQAKYGSIDPVAAEKEPLDPEEQFLQQIRQIVESNLEDEGFGIARLCREMYISRSQLHRKLKALTGKSTSHFIRDIRLNKSKELLLNTSLPISQIAFEVGFRKPAYFSEVFSETFGESPSDFRKNHKV